MRRGLLHTTRSKRAALCRRSERRGAKPSGHLDVGLQPVVASEHRQYENLGGLHLGRSWLPLCNACGHPFAAHTVGTVKPRVDPDCTDCPRPCSYVYPYPLCPGCAEPVETNTYAKASEIWHRACWGGRSLHETDERSSVQQGMAS